MSDGIPRANKTIAVKTTLETGGEDLKTTLETGGKDLKTTLETGGKDLKTTLETGGEDLKTTLAHTHSFIISLLKCYLFSSRHG